jgi:hypothetical protein
LKIWGFLLPRNAPYVSRDCYPTVKVQLPVDIVTVKVHQASVENLPAKVETAAFLASLVTVR